MKKFLCWFALAASLYVLETSLLPLIFYHGVGADLLLLMTISFAFLRGKRLGAFMGFMLGLFDDLASGGFLGMHAFSDMALGYGCGIFSNRVLRDSFILPITSAFFSTIAVFVFYEIMLLLLGYGFYPLAHLRLKFLPMLLYNMVFVWPVYSLVVKVNRFTAKKK